MSPNRPVVLVIAGPNGSGKTTLTKNMATFGTYINADDLQKEYNISILEAAKQSELLRNDLLEKSADFSFETVLSTERNILLLQKAKAKGYEIQCIYVLTCDENINVARVRSRKAAGGHDVPEDKIRNRYHRSLGLLPRLIDICDKVLIFDNSDMPSLIFSKAGKSTKLTPNKNWPKTKLLKLLGLSSNN